ncbi:Rrf2 family protein [Rhizobium leguminosarum]
MKMGDGVEQAIHSVAMLSGLSEGGVLSAAALAEFHGVSTSYLLKHLQALSGAGILDTVPGPKGGYRLAKAPKEISLLDIVLAVEGAAPAFRCAEIPPARTEPGLRTLVRPALHHQRGDAESRTGLSSRTRQDEPGRYRH